MEQEKDHELPITGAELGLVARGIGAIRRALRRPDPVTRLRYRETIRNEIRRKLEWPEKDEVPEIVVIRLGKERKYPEPDLRLFGFCVSPWMKLEVKDLRDEGIEVFTGIEQVEIRRGKAHPIDSDDASDAPTVYSAGIIPYERIAHIDWGPDPAYGLPRFYVAYGCRGPLRERAVYERNGYKGYLFRIPGVKMKPRRIAPWKLVWWHWQTRRDYKRAQRGKV